MSTSIEGHIVQRYDGELNGLYIRTIELGGLVLEQARQALESLVEEDLELATWVLDRETKVNALKGNIDEAVLTLIARRSPMAKDLRVILAMAKASSDLERAGDEAARIAGITDSVYDNERSDPSAFLMRDISTMGKLCLSMLQEGLEVMDTLDVTQARRLARQHRELDAEFQSSLRRLTTFVLEDARNVGHIIHVVLAIKALERIGDYAKNLADYVVYLVTGEDVRHRPEPNEQQVATGHPAA